MTRDSFSRRRRCRSQYLTRVRTPCRIETTMPPELRYASIHNIIIINIIVIMNVHRRTSYPCHGPFIEFDPRTTTVRGVTMCDEGMRHQKKKKTSQVDGENI